MSDDTTIQSQTVMTYDDLGNLISVTDPEGGVTQFTAYDIMGNVLTRERHRGRVFILHSSGLYVKSEDATPKF